MKRVLVTGANGFVGRNTLVPLIMRGFEVHATSSRLVSHELSGVHWHKVNLLDSTETYRLIKAISPTHMLHFAWYAEPGKFWHASENFHWLEASIALLRYFRENGGERVVMAGTCAEYDWDFGYCSEAVTPCRPATVYGVCKNALQEILSAYSNAENNMSMAWGRIFFLYGPGEHPTRLISSVINSLLRGETARCSHGNQIRDFMHVEDVASAFVTLLDSSVEGSVNIASARPTSLREIVLDVADYLHAKERVHFGALSTPENEPLFLVGDCRRLVNEVGWSPHYDLYAGIEQTVNWWISQSGEFGKL